MESTFFYKTTVFVPLDLSFSFASADFDFIHDVFFDFLTSCGTVFFRIDGTCVFDKHLTDASCKCNPKIRIFYIFYGEKNWYYCLLWRRCQRRPDRNRYKLYTLQRIMSFIPKPIIKTHG